ncbi:hypothetical protein CRE_30913 [Caenorhabditis remanei]|uniref:Uncharacterized protein n=1 Tax=Caenorhabditis remanei TaxID=31234 RepID=E3LTI4_CAERE|nr:hypothetical protein CRE_30913 [Caenorhabditis remanei]
MDARVPRNNAERRVRPKLAYRPRKPYLNPPPPSQMDIIRQHVLNTMHEQAEAHEREIAKRQLIESIQGETRPIKPKKVRRKYQMPVWRSIDDDGKPIENGDFTPATARDLAKLVPVDQSAIVICNPEKAICRIKLKKPEEKIETVAKPRYSTPSHTILFTKKYDKASDLDKVLEELYP